MLHFGALEAGGTKMVCAVGNAQGQILERISLPTRDPENTMPEILAFFREKQVSAVGVGCSGWQDLLDKGQLKGALRNFDKQWKERLQQQTDTKEALSRLQAELDARQHEQETHVVQIKDKQSKTIALETDLSALRSQRALILEGRPTHEVENQNRRRQEELQQHWDIDRKSVV